MKYYLSGLKKELKKKKKIKTERKGNNHRSRMCMCERVYVEGWGGGGGGQGRLRKTGRGGWKRRGESCRYTPLPTPDIFQIHYVGG